MNNLLSIIICLITLASNIRAQSQSVDIIYLGHASFLFKFNNGKTVITDYGISNVYKEYGYESPIYQMNFTPDIATFSHTHQDHFGGKLHDSVKYILIGPDSLSLDWIEIKTLPAYENSLVEPDNFSYLFKYKELKILHMGDIQSLIINNRNPEIQEKIKSLYKAEYDVVFIPIGFTENIVTQAVEFVRMLRARVIVPMHYWKQEEKKEFIQLLTNKKLFDLKEYRIVRADSGSYRYVQNKVPDEIIIILDIEPAPLKKSDE